MFESIRGTPQTIQKIDEVNMSYGHSKARKGKMSYHVSCLKA